MQVRIVNDGQHFYHTQFTSVETGEELQYVTEALIRYKAGEPLPTVQLTMIHPSVDIIADAEIRHICPCCGRDMPEEKV